MLQIVFNKKSVKVLCLLIVGSLFACSNNGIENALHVPYYTTADFTPLWLDAESDKEKINQLHTLDTFAFTNQEGKIITEKSIENKIHVANFFFTTCPSVCPKMTIEFQRLQKEFALDSTVVLLSYTVTPWKDSVTRLADYAKINEVNATKWHLLTGSKKEIYTLARTSYFAEEALGFTKDSTEFLHTEHFILVDKNKHIRGIYKGTLALETERLVADIKMLKKGK